MESLELEKIKITKEIPNLKEEDRPALKEIRRILHKIKSAPRACQLTTDELKTDIKDVLKDVQAGRVTKHEEFGKEI